MRITAHNDNGATISTWESVDAAADLIRNARGVNAIGGFTVDGIGIFTVERDAYREKLVGFSTLVGAGRDATFVSIQPRDLAAFI